MARMWHCFSLFDEISKKTKAPLTATAILPAVLCVRQSRSRLSLGANPIHCRKPISYVYIPSFLPIEVVAGAGVDLFVRGAVGCAGQARYCCKND